MLPMAGKSKRFQEEGIVVPKYLLPLHSQPILHWIIEGLSLRHGELVVFVLGNHNNSDRNVLLQILKRSKIENYEIVILESESEGQAHTVDLALKSLVKTSPYNDLLIFNVDTIRIGLRVPEHIETDIWIETFQEDGNHWSFVVPKGNSSSMVSKIVEKKRVSRFCSTGAYYFSESTHFQLGFREIWRKKITSPSQDKEIYVSQIINELIGIGAKASYTNIERNKILLAGTPKEYHKLIRESSQVRDFTSLFTNLREG